ncbi:MAG: alpha/beta fold hydrolase [Candidatus Nanopelagicales bacterium]
MRPIRSIAISVTSLGLVAGVLVGATAPTAAAAAGDRGTITWHDCDPDADLEGFECGTLTVPLDWDNLENPANAEIELALHRATSDKRIGALTFNPGGPGAAGLGIANPVLGLLPAKVRNRFDFVAWDPRGVGESQPQLTNCGVGQTPEGFYEPPATGPVDWTAFATDFYDETAAANAQCLDANPDVAPYLGTYYVIRDLDAMRAALGEEQWNFWGMSYGTRIGFRYAREFPDRLRTLLLDGSWSPNLTVTSWMNGATWNYGTAQAVFSSQFGEKMGYRLQRVIDGLDEQTIIVDGEEYTRWQVLPQIFNNISYQSSYPQILDVITAAYKALYAPTAKKRRAAARKIAEPLAELRLNTPSTALNINFINCRDMANYPGVDEIARAAEVSAANNSVAAGTVALTKGSLCAGLPQDFTYGYAPLTESLQLPIKPVVINSLGDTRTEYDFGRTMANFLWGASLITYDGTQHVTYKATPSTCVNNPVTNYFLYRTAPGSLLCPYAPLPTS